MKCSFPFTIIALLFTFHGITEAQAQAALATSAQALPDLLGARPFQVA